jgi:hypothetical protein
VACGNKLDRRHGIDSEVTIVSLNGLKQTDAEMDFAALEQRQCVGADCLDQFHLHARIAFRILVQERRKHRFDLHGRGGDLQHSRVAVPEQLRLFAQCNDGTQQAAATSEQLLSRASQEKTAAYTIEQGQAELLLEVADLPRKSGLGRAQVQCGFGNRSQLRHGDECPQMPEVHTRSLCPAGMDI